MIWNTPILIFILNILMQYYSLRKDFGLFNHKSKNMFSHFLESPDATSERYL